MASPHDLVPPIVFLYDCAGGGKGMLDSLLHYCGACFTTQKLGPSAENRSSFHSDCALMRGWDGMDEREATTEQKENGSSTDNGPTGVLRSRPLRRSARRAAAGPWASASCGARGAYDPKLDTT